MRAIEDALDVIGKALVHVADRQQLDLFAEYVKMVQRFCDVMADLNLYEVMLKCLEFQEAPEVEESSDEEPVTFKITIKQDDGKIFTLVLDAKESIGSVKNAIVPGSGIPVDRQVLKFNGTTLDHNGSTLEGAGLHDGADLTLEPFRVAVTVNTMDGKQIKVMVDPADYITDLKVQLEKESGIAAKNQALFKSGEELSDLSKTCGELGIKAGSVIDLQPKVINVSVKAPDGKKFDVQVKPSDSAEDVKAKIEQETGLKVPHQVLKYNGKEMPDGTTVKEMGITEGSELTVDLFKVPVTVKTFDGKEFKVMVNPSDYISDLKHQLQDESGVPAKNQKLSLGEKELEDPNKTAGDYGIKAGSVIDLEPKVIKVNVKTPEGKTICVQVNVNDKAEAIKAKIEKESGFTVPQQVLKYSGKPMPNGTTVKDMGIRDGSILTVDIFKVPVIVKTYDGKEIKIMVDPTDSLFKVKGQLEEESGIPAKNQKLSMAGKEMADPNKTAGEYGIKAGSVLDLEPKVINVNVKTPDGKIISVEVTANDSAEAIKAKIEKEAGLTVPQQVLKYNGKEMTNGTTVKDIGIKDGSDLIVDIFKVPVIVNTMDGKKIKVMVDPTDKISEIKRQLEEESGIPAKNQKLSMGGEELADANKTAKDYGVRAGSVLDLEPKIIKITVETPDGKKHEVDIKSSDNSDDIKSKVAKTSGMAAPRQVLMFNGNELPDGKAVKDMGIQDGSSIKVDVFLIPISVKTPGGQTVTLGIEPTDTIDAIKKMLEKETGLEAKKQLLKLGEEELKFFRKTAKECGIKKNSELVLEEVDDPIIFVDIKAGTLFSVDRDQAIKIGALSPHQNNKLDFAEAAKDSATRDKILEAMKGSPTLGVASQVVVTGMEVEDYELEEKEKVQSVWGVNLKKREKNKRGEEFLFIDPKTGAAGELSRQKYIDNKFITVVQSPKGETIEEREKDNMKYDKYIAMIRKTFGMKEFD